MGETSKEATTTVYGFYNVILPRDMLYPRDLHVPI
jgi:hypothetical protein